MSESERESARAFIALPLEARLLGHVQDLQEQLKPRLAGIRMVRPDSIHLTLRFLGPMTSVQSERLAAALAAAAASCAPAEARVRGLGTFPERGSPRVLWLGIDVPPQIGELQQACERAARAAGFEREERRFRAHLTLGRWRDRAARLELPDADLGATPLETLVLYQSELRPDGAVYSALRRFELGRAVD